MSDESDEWRSDRRSGRSEGQESKKMHEGHCYGGGCSVDHEEEGGGGTVRTHYLMYKKGY